MKKMQEAGINLAIGTDGPASNNCLDMFREMFLVTGLAKLREHDAAVMDANDVLYMATTGGAKAMGLIRLRLSGSWEKADLFLIGPDAAEYAAEHNLTKNLVYSGSKQNVKLTMVNGKILYEDGQFFSSVKNRRDL